MRHIASLLILMLLIGTASANSGTITLYGTNASNTQSNLTRVGTNATVNVSAWAIGDAVKTFTVNVSDLSDVNAFVLGNFTVGRVIEVKVNGTSYNAYKADSKGEITFNRTQNKGNQTYAVNPALQANYNMSWLFIDGSPINHTTYLPLTGGTMTGDILHTGSNWNVRTTDGTALNLGFNGVTALGINAAGNTNYVAIDDVFLLYPLQVSTSRPAYRQGGLIFNTTTKSLEVAGDNNQWASLNRFRNLTYSSPLNDSGRAANTVYQNANSTPMFVTISYAQDGTGSQWLKTDTANPPLTLQARINTTTTAVSQLSGIVPAYHYYSVGGSGSSISLWREVQ